MSVLSRRSILQLAMAPAFLTRAQVEDLAPTVSRVYPGTDGRLVYVPDEHGNTIHDSSHAGYAGGGVPIPTVPVKLTIWPVAGDNTENIQAAIDKVSALAPDKSGFRGAVLLRAGYYKMAMPLRIQASGVVLRGEGMGDIGTVLVGTGTGRPPAPAGPGGGPGGQGGPGGGFGGGQSTLVQIAGASGVTTNDETKQVIVDEYVPVGARSFTVTSARAYRRGDTVIVRRIGNEEWIAAIGMNGETPQSRWKPFNVDWDRVVTDVQGNTITIDAPITCAIEKRWGGGEVMKYEDAGRIEKVGVENLRGMSEFDPTVRTKEYGNMDRPNYVAEEYYADENHYRNFITFDNMRNGWVRNATALAFRLQHGGHRARIEVDHGAGLRVARADLAEDGCAPVYVRAPRTTGARAAVPLRQGPPLIHDGPADGERKRVPRLQGDQPVFVERTARAVGNREPLRQRRSAAHRAVLEEHQHRMGGRQYGVLELRGDRSSSRNRRRRRISRSATSASTPWCSTFRSRIRRKKAGISSRWTGTSRRGVSI